MIRKICKYVIFKPTFLDILTDENNKDNFLYQQDLHLDIKNYFVNYCRVKSYEGSLLNLYTEIKTFLDSAKSSLKQSKS